jgi:hypothetical protein
VSNSRCTYVADRMKERSFKPGGRFFERQNSWPVGCGDNKGINVSNENKTRGSILDPQPSKFRVQGFPLLSPNLACRRLLVSFVLVTAL